MNVALWAVVPEMQKEMANLKTKWQKMKGEGDGSRDRGRDDQSEKNIAKTKIKRCYYKEKII